MERCGCNLHQVFRVIRLKAIPNVQKRSLDDSHSVQVEFKEVPVYVHAAGKGYCVLGRGRAGVDGAEQELWR